MMHIRVDDREDGSGTAAALREMTGVEVVVTRLPLGDYEVDRRFLFERKTLADLAASLKDGRLLRQACLLAAAPLRSVLILEGTARDHTGGTRREAIQGALVTITVLLNIPLLRAKTPEESARLMVYAARQLKALHDDRPKEAHPRLPGGKRPRGKRKTQLHLLQGLPGVGPKRARRLLDRFGSVEAVLTAAAEELALVEGVGEGTAQAIRWAVSEQRLDYDAFGERAG